MDFLSNFYLACAKMNGKIGRKIFRVLLDFLSNFRQASMITDVILWFSSISLKFLFHFASSITMYTIYPLFGSFEYRHLLLTS